MGFKEGDIVTRTEGELMSLKAKVIDPYVELQYKRFLVRIQFEDSPLHYCYPIEALKAEAI